MRTRVVHIGNRAIGGKNPVLVQSMCNTRTYDVPATVRQIRKLTNAGCEIIRVAVPDEKSARALKEIKKKISIPLVADIHFDYKLAILSARYADKIRINPGNIGTENHLAKVIDACRDIPIRIGVNLGSLQKDSLKRFGRTPRAMVDSALKHIAFFEKNDFTQIVVSLKASDVLATIKANRLFSQKSRYPLHIGVTEAGTLFEGTIKSSIGIGSLLADGIGDTIRVSLTADPIEELAVAYSILRNLGLRKGRRFISCPTCGRTQKGFLKIAQTIESKTVHIDKDISIAVMGCEVNGPGEAKDADIGIALSNNLAYIFKKGKNIRQIDPKSAIDELLKEIDRLE